MTTFLSFPTTSRKAQPVALPHGVKCEASLTVGKDRHCGLSGEPGGPLLFVLAKNAKAPEGAIAE